MKKQTAVEWLIDEIRNHIKEHGRLDAITISALRTMGKGMEKQQIIEAYNTGELHCVADPKTSLDYYQHYYGQ